MTQITHTVSVQLGDRSYDILVGHGLLARLGPETVARMGSGKAEGRLAVVFSDHSIFRRYGKAVVRSLKDAGFQVHVLTISHGEKRKTLTSIQRFYQALFDQSADRRTVVIALGGGVIGDMAGFAAATYTRGLEFVQVPTTLLAQVDSSVGGKTGVNFGAAKNLIGSFHQPRLVVIDPETLRTLPLRERRSGLAEVIKYGIIGDKDFFALLTREVAGLLDLSSPELEYVLAHSCAMKARVVEQDERDEGLRAILNFGHTVGHALESITNYKTYTHGEAIALGMVSAAFVGEEVGVTRPADTSALLDLLRAAGFAVRLDAEHSIEEITRLLAWDKKSVGGSARFVLMEGIGRATPGHSVPEAAIWKALERQQELD
ncbi:MAG: 3-dehydroquinate synthase [Armatimonadota bacterium]|nr:3-dehydroquinate synthase [Armatimonadota bacterium]